MDRKTVLPTDLSVALTDKSVVTTNFVCCLNNLEFFETTDGLGWDNRFVGQLFLLAQDIWFFGDGDLRGV
jgi:hypothetical protein